MWSTFPTPSSNGSKHFLSCHTGFPARTPSSGFFPVWTPTLLNTVLFNGPKFSPAAAAANWWRSTAKRFAAPSHLLTFSPFTLFTPFTHAPPIHPQHPLDPPLDP